MNKHTPLLKLPSLLILISLIIYIINTTTYTETFTKAYFLNIGYFVVIYGLCLLLVEKNKAAGKWIYLLVTAYFVFTTRYTLQYWNVAPVFTIIFLLQIMLQIIAVVLLFMKRVK